MRDYLLSFILFFSMIWSSCEKEVKFDFDNQERLVVFSNFSDQNDLEVLVYTTQSRLTPTETTRFLTDATVMVFSGGQLIEILNLVPADPEASTPPYYRSETLVPKVGVIYSIKVSVPGYETVTATNSIPQPVPIQAVDFSSNFIVNVEDETSVNFNIDVTIQDPQEVANYYHIIFYQEIIPYTVDEKGDSLLGEVAFLMPRSLKIGPETPAVKHFDGKSLLAKDATFNGQEVTFSVEGSYSFNPALYLPGRFLVELRTVSEAYYYYHTTLTLQQEAGEGPLSPGVVVFDNVENGFGIFAGFSSAFNFFNLKN